MRAPEPLTRNHIIDGFGSRRESLYAWLKERAITNEEQGSSRTFVICDDEGKRVIGYYCLAKVPLVTMLFLQSSGSTCQTPVLSPFSAVLPWIKPGQEKVLAWPC
jgi:hypothetical protein